LSAGAVGFQAESRTPHRAKANGGLRRANPPCGLPQFKNVCSLRTLAKKSAIQGGVSQLRRLGIKQTAEETLVRSEGWIRPAEFLDRGPRDELKESISLV
jgi:hypothetical protein